MTQRNDATQDKKMPGKTLGDHRPHVLIVTGDVIGKQMAGPAIRVWHMAEAISRVADVRVVSWQKIGRVAENFELHYVSDVDDATASKHEAWADVIIVQGMSFRIFPSIARTTKIVVADLYDPIQLEQLEQNKYRPIGYWRDEVTKAVSLVNEQLARADFIICATDRQRDLWLGNLSALGRLNPNVYSADSSFDSLLALVPFGLETSPATQTRHAIKGTVPGIASTDKVIIWGGGIYNWFDTLTLVEAMALLAPRHPEVKLFFLSARHFNPDISEMQMSTATIARAEALGLIDSTVFFNDTWVDYDDRVNYLLDADLGVSTHFIHAETRFSFRTRMLDYLWAGLPIVATEGDSFAALIAEKGLGVAVPQQDPAALAAAIEHALFDEDFARGARKNVATIRPEFAWSQVLKPLVDFCADPHESADHALMKAEGARAFGGNDFDRILAMPRGFARDLALLRHYLSQGGLALVKEKLSERRSRNMRRRKN